MERDRYARVRELFHELFPLDEDEREARLAALEPDLREELRALLDRSAAGILAEEGLGRVGERLVERELAEVPAAAAPLPERIGPFRVERRLGAGGMGVVYLARQEEPVRREVALKVVRATLGDADSLARFAIEREVLARLSHPNVARLYEAGATDDGAPYFAMEYVPGEDLVQYADGAGLDVEARLHLFRDVCAGVQHAHQKGVLHRDLKPSNLLVAEDQGRAVPKVIDFGIAKLADAERNTGPGLTGQGWIGSPAYMSPEAIAGGEVDTRADVYSLGIVLYELLAGVRPRAEAPSPVPLRRDEPTPKPSTRYAALDEGTARAIAASRGLAPRALAKRFRGDLDWIVMKAIAVEPERRYASAAELAADLGRHLAHEPVVARPPTTAYLARRFARRHRVPLAAAALVLLSLVLGLVGLTRGLVRARDAERDALREARRADDEARTARAAEQEAREHAARAEREAEIARGVERFLVGIFELSDPNEARGQTVTARELLDSGAADIEAELADRPQLRARMMRTIGKVYAQLALYRAARPLLERALAIHAERAESVPLELAESHLELGRLALLEGRVDEAGKQLERALRLREEHLTARDFAVAECLILLGTADYRAGRCAAAAPRWERALDVLDELGIAASPANATTLTLVGACLAGTDDAAALPCFARALAIREATLPADHPDVARASINLGIHLYRLGRPEDARPRIRRGVEITERVFGPDHPELATGLFALAEVTADFDEAEPLYLRGLEVIERASPQSASLAGLCAVIGTRYMSEGLAEEAAGFLEEAVARREELLPPDHPDLMVALSNLALAYAAQERLEEALTLMERVLEARLRTLAPTDPLLANAFHNLGRLVARLGRAEEAEAPVRRAVEIRLEALGPDAWPTLESQLTLAEVLDASDRSEDAEQLFREVVERLERSALPEDERASAHVAVVLHARRHADPDQVLALAEAALADDAAFPPDHPDRAGLSACRALALCALGRDAGPELERASASPESRVHARWDEVMEEARARAAAPR